MGLRTLVLGVGFVLSSVGCAEQSPAGPSAVLTTDVLIRQLEQQGATVALGGDMPRDAFPFFSVNARRLLVNGEDVQVFEYPDDKAAEQEAARVGPTGSPIGTTQVLWIAPPRFYRKGRLIVLYVGKTGEVVRSLEAILGPPFVGPA